MMIGIYTVRMNASGLLGRNQIGDREPDEDHERNQTSPILPMDLKGNTSFFESQIS
jgi:hypothetical protein